MLLLSLDSTGLRTMLVLQIFCLTLCSTTGRPWFEDGDEDLVADNDGDGDPVDDEDHEEDEAPTDNEHEDENEENDPSTPRPMTTEECEKMAAEQKKNKESVELCVKTSLVAQAKRRDKGGAGTGPGDEYDEYFT